MSRFNTGNPLGSGSPLDLDDNAKNMDLAVNSDGDTFQDRMGKSRLTWAGIVKAGSGDAGIIVPIVQQAVQAVQDVIDGVDGAVDEAQGYAQQAEAASNAAFINAGIYPDVASGLAAVAIGEQFQVISADGLEYRRYRKDSETVATEVGEGFPSPLYLRAVADEARRKTWFDSPEQGVDTDSGVEAGDLYWVRESLASESSELYRNVDGRPVDTGIREGFIQFGAPSAITLMGNEPQGVAIDISTSVADAEVKILDLNAPANNFTGSLADTAYADTAKARMVTLENGAIGWSDHNLLRYSEEFAPWAKKGATVGAKIGRVTPITASANGESYIYLSAARARASSFYRVDLTFKSGSAPYGYIAYDNEGTRYQYFNARTGQPGVASPGVESEYFTVDEQGYPLPKGFFRVSAIVRNREESTQFQVQVGICNADGDPAAITGQSFGVEGVSLMRGTKAPTIRVRTNGSERHLPHYDWSRGARCLLIENYSIRPVGLWSDDLTNTEWVKTGCAASFGVLGPHGEPSSQISVEVSGATVLQSTGTTSSTSRTFQAFIRRVSGSGSIKITADNGDSWIDVTDQITEGAYTKVYAHKSGSNLGFGISFEGVGDVVDVALANYTTNPMVVSPIPIYGIEETIAASPFSVPLPDYQYEDGVSAYIDYYKSEDPGASGITHAGFAGSGSGRAWMTAQGVGNLSRVDTSTGGLTMNTRVGNFSPGSRIEVSMLVRDMGMATSAHGQGETYSNTAAPTDLNRFMLTSSLSQMFLRRVLISPRYLGPDGLADWRYSGEGADARYIADAKIARHGEIPGTTLCREPSVAVLSENSESAHLATVFMNKNEFSAGTHSEMPARLMRKDFSFNKVTGELTPLSDPFVIQQQENWDEGLGHLQGGKLIKVRVNEKRGRLLFLWTQLDTENGLVSPDWRRIYCKHSDDNGVRWSDPVMIHDPGEGNFAILTGGGYVELTDGPNKGRIVVPFSRPVRCLYSDDGGDTWSVGQPGLNTGTDTEPSISLRPDGSTIVMTLRKLTGPVWRSYCYSYDGGETLTEVLPISGYEGTGVFLSTVQADTEGGNGRQGKLLLCGARSDSPTRSRLAVEELIGENLTPSGEQFLPLDPGRATGYTSAVHLSGGFVAIAYESAPTSSYNSYCDVRMMVVSDKV